MWLCGVSIAVRGLSLAAENGDYSVVMKGLLIVVASLVAVGLSGGSDGK